MGSPPVPARGLARAVNRESCVLYLLIFVTAVSQRTIVPLLPVVEHRYGLHQAAVAGVLVLPSLAMLVTATPIGILGDRIGNRRVTPAAGALLGLAGLGRAIPSLLALVLARLAFGIGYGAMWTAGPAWLAGLRSGTASRRLGATTLASGVGSAVGPTVACCSPARSLRRRLRAPRAAGHHPPDRCVAGCAPGARPAPRRRRVVAGLGGRRRRLQVARPPACPGRDSNPHDLSVRGV